MRVPVKTDCITNAMTTASLDCASTNQEWVEEVATKSGVVDTTGYAIYLNRWGVSFSLNDKGGGKGEKGMHIMDAISKADTKHLAKEPGTTSAQTAEIFGQLSFRREFFTSDYDPMLDKEGTVRMRLRALLLVFKTQLQFNLSSAVYTCSIYVRVLVIASVSLCYLPL